MALGQRRMVYTNLWQNVEFARLSDKAKLLYIGTITVADDDGRLRGNSLLLRSSIFPLDERISPTDVRRWLNEILRAKLITYYKDGSEYFIQHPNWKKYQFIRSDMYKPSRIPPPVTKMLQKRYSKLNKDKVSKDNKKEVDANAPPTPAEINRDFFKAGDTYRVLLHNFSEKMDPNLAEKEFQKFVLYWTETNKSGTKERWEQQATFDVKRRLFTWFNNIADRQKASAISKGRGLA